MSKLLKANFYKLFHSKVYWIGFLLMPFLNLYNAFTSSSLLTLHEEQGKYGAYWVGWNFNDISTYLAHLWYISYVIIAVTALFVGDEFSSGSIRNKILAGHSRPKIYLSYFISSYVGMMLIHITSEVLGLGYCLTRYGLKFYHTADNFTESIKNSMTLSLHLNISAVISIAALVGIALLCMIAAARKVLGLVMTIVLNIISNVYVENKMYDIIIYHQSNLQLDKREIMLLSLDPNGLIKSNLIEWNKYHASSVLCCLLTLCVLIAVGILIMKKRELK